jgi:hypothetical protein
MMKRVLVMDNSFLSNFNFENEKSEFIMEWLNLLCDTDDRLNKFVEEFLDTHNIFHSACNYQRYLRSEEKRGQNIQIGNILQAVAIKDLVKLKSIFQEMFIEPVDKEALKYFMKITEERKMVINDFIDLHNMDQEKSFWLILKKVM